MASSTDPNLGLEHSWEYRESGWKTGMDANLKKLGAVVQLAVLSMKDDIPATPANGDRHIIPAGATGEWSGRTGQIAVRVAGAWEYYAPATGWRAWVADIGSIATFTGAAWVPEWTAPPTAPDDPGVAGQMAYEPGYLYICVAADTWKRIATDDTWIT